MEGAVYGVVDYVQGDYGYQVGVFACFVAAVGEGVGLDHSEEEGVGEDVFFGDVDSGAGDYGAAAVAAEAGAVDEEVVVFFVQPALDLGEDALADDGAVAVAVDFAFGEADQVDVVAFADAGGVELVAGEGFACEEGEAFEALGDERAVGDGHHGDVGFGVDGPLVFGVAEAAQAEDGGVGLVDLVVADEHVAGQFVDFLDDVAAGDEPDPEVGGVFGRWVLIGVDVEEGGAEVVGLGLGEPLGFALEFDAEDGDGFEVAGEDWMHVPLRIPCGRAQLGPSAASTARTGM